jgi:hypothetical protein
MLLACQFTREETPMATSIFCVAQSDDIARSIVEELEVSGVRSNDVSILFPDTTALTSFAAERDIHVLKRTSVCTSAGIAFGGALAWLVSIGSLSIPGIGPFIAAGPIGTALAGATIGATLGGLAGALVGLGISKIEAKRYEDKIRKGGILVSAHALNRCEISRVKSIFITEGAEDISAVGVAASDR